MKYDFKNSFQTLTLIITLASVKNLEAEPNPQFTWTHGMPFFPSGASHTLISPVYYSPIYYYILPFNRKSPSFQILPYLVNNNPFYKSHKCNKLEKLINKERKKKGLKALKCDYGLYYVAWWHTKAQ